MRDPFTTLRSRLLLGLAGASLLAPACSSSTSPAQGDSGPAATDQPAADVVAPLDVASTDVAMSTDVVMSTDTVRPTDVAMSTDVVMTTDTVRPSDVAMSTDAVTPLDVPADGTPTPTPTCGFGTPTARCFTPEALEALVRNPFGGGEGPLDAASDVVTDVPRTANGCYAPSSVADDCCIRPSGESWRVGDQCCYWFCTGACCGRPFTVAGGARVADVVPSGAWRALVDPAALDAVTLDALARAWADDAAMEHAAVASFARHTLQLLAVGADPELVLAANGAVADEVEHARLCFTLASRYAGRALGPGALDVGGAMGPTALRDVLRAVIAEGCVGETLASLVASAQRDVARDPAVVAALDRIADDEARHAELGWRFVAWALRGADDSLRRDAQRAFARALEAPVTVADEPAGVDPAAWAAHGRLTAEAQRAVMVRGLREVVAPCAAALSLDAPCREARA